MFNVLITEAQLVYILDFLNEEESYIGKKKFVNWTINDIEQEVKKYDNITDFRNNSLSAYVAAKRLGILDTLFPNRETYTKWDENRVRDEAKKYKNKREFDKKASRAYRIALELGILDELFPVKKRVYNIPSVEAMRTIASILKINGYDDEKIVDSLINLRNKDYETYNTLKTLSTKQNFIDSVERLMYLS